MKLLKNYLIALTAVTVFISLTGCSSSKSRSSDSGDRGQLQAMMLASATNPNAIPSFRPRPMRPQDEIGPGNLVRISCTVDSKISGEYRIGFDGFVKLPYDVQIQAAGLSTSQLREALTQRYRGFFRGAPAFDVSIEERKYFVRAQGLVSKPGEYLVAPDGSLDAVIAEAGGLQLSNEQAPVARYASIADGQYRAAIKLSDYFGGAANSSPLWRGGETVSFRNDGEGLGDIFGADRRYVQVVGQVRNPGEYLHRDQANFFHYLVQAGGPTDRASMNHVLLMRSERGQMQAMPFSMKEPEKIPEIRGGDIVLVQADNPTDLERDTSVFGNIGGFMSAVAATVLMAAGL